MSREAFMDAVARYWEAAYDEGAMRATHDTEDARAATALHDIKQEYDALAARLAEAERKEAGHLNVICDLQRWRMEAEALLMECDSTLAGLGHGWLRDKIAAFLAPDSASGEGEK